MKPNPVEIINPFPCWFCEKAIVGYPCPYCHNYEREESIVHETRRVRCRVCDQMIKKYPCPYCKTDKK